MKEIRCKHPISMIFSVLGAPCQLLSPLIGTDKEQRAQEGWETAHRSSTVKHPLTHRLRGSVVCRFFPDKGSKLCFPHWQADSLPQSRQGSPQSIILFFVFYLTPLGFFVCLIDIFFFLFFAHLFLLSHLLQVYEYFTESHLIVLLAIYSPFYYFYSGCARDYNTHS